MTETDTKIESEINWKLPRMGKVYQIKMHSPFFIKVKESLEPILIKPKVEVYVTGIGYFGENDPWCGDAYVTFGVMGEPDKELILPRAMFQLVNMFGTGTTILEIEKQASTKTSSRFTSL